MRNAAPPLHARNTEGKACGVQVSDYLMALAVNGMMGGQPATGIVLREDLMNDVHVQQE